MTVQQEEKKLTESIWFWIYLFSTAGLISLVVIQGKFDTRQDLEEVNFRARMQTYTGEPEIVNKQTITDTNSEDLQNTGDQQIVTLTPLYILFGLIFAVSWFILWKQRILGRRTPVDTSGKTNFKTPISTEH